MFRIIVHAEAEVSRCIHIGAVANAFCGKVSRGEEKGIQQRNMKHDAIVAWSYPMQTRWRIYLGNAQLRWRQYNETRKKHKRVIVACGSITHSR
jgi:hypothetical protein